MASPACKAFTQLRHLNRIRTDPRKLQQTLAEGQLMWDFSLEAINEQLHQENYFGLNIRNRPLLGHFRRHSVS